MWHLLSSMILLQTEDKNENRNMRHQAIENRICGTKFSHPSYHHQLDTMPMAHLESQLAKFIPPQGISAVRAQYSSSLPSCSSSGRLRTVKSAWRYIEMPAHHSVSHIKPTQNEALIDEANTYTIILRAESPKSKKWANPSTQHNGFVRKQMALY